MFFQMCRRTKPAPRLWYKFAVCLMFIFLPHELIRIPKKVDFFAIVSLSFPLLSSTAYSACSPWSLCQKQDLSQNSCNGFSSCMGLFISLYLSSWFEVFQHICGVEMTPCCLTYLLYAHHSVSDVWLQERGIAARQNTILQL